MFRYEIVVDTLRRYPPLLLRISFSTKNVIPPRVQPPIRKINSRYELLPLEPLKASLFCPTNY